MPNLICIKYIFCGFTLLRCSFTVHQLVERSQAGARCDCPFFLRPLQTTWYFLTSYKHCARNWEWHGPGQAGRSSLLFRGREAVRSWAEEHLGTDTAVSCEWWESLSSAPTAPIPHRCVKVNLNTHWRAQLTGQTAWPKFWKGENSKSGSTQVMPLTISDL